MNLWTLIYIFLLLWVIYIYIKHFAPLRKREEGYPYVFVEFDSTVRELYEDEKEYLNTVFEPTDSGRPNVKGYYGQVTPNGKIDGFVLRRRVPFWIKIKEI
jgi:hypothetical protein